MDGQTDVQREAIIPRHYCMAGYKKVTVSDIMTITMKSFIGRDFGHTFVLLFSIIYWSLFTK